MAAFSFQGHPEASPGPQELSYLFDHLLRTFEHLRASWYKNNVAKRTDLQRILIIGAGPIVIGQALEFDYSGVQACKALKEEGYDIILVKL